ncbi:MAG: GNAT family N-acetyltransferase [Bacteroidia bacterium]
MKMNITKNYLFTSARLGFRNWEDADLEGMARINADEKVMEFFPSVATEKETHEFITRMQAQFSEKGFCYFAVDRLEDHSFIGFIGLSEKTFEADFTPCIDIGWRLDCAEWNKGYATEGAKRCLEYAFEDLRLNNIYSIAPKVNVKSEQVMKKIGMIKLYEFAHPLLKNDERLENCVLYMIGC